MPKTCAIYTRKSTDEGLDQNFNSLDAQREACEAYIKSQSQENWTLLEDRFDDGGISGGTMERPGLKRLMTLIEEGLVDVIVVYKVDRLTRSLADFARIVDLLDLKGASFVSVTQQFNTTTSMGRLTLNVLLSFAQFEREVTAERIRDKISASKKKGMWMGGNIPLGYDAIDRKLMVNATEAETVREIFRTYIRLRSIPALAEELERRGLRSKKRTKKDGTVIGGVPFYHGALSTLLNNRTYLGQVAYKGTIYDGEHEAIVAGDLWDRVQTVLESNRYQRTKRNTASPSFLKGLLFTLAGTRYSPSHAKKQGKRYRYYQTPKNKVSTVDRLPAPQLETHVVSELKTLFEDPKRLEDELVSMGIKPDPRRLLVQATALAANLIDPFETEASDTTRRFVNRIVVDDRTLNIHIDPTDLAGSLTKTAIDKEVSWPSLTLTSEVQFKPTGTGFKLITPPKAQDTAIGGTKVKGQCDPHLLKTLRQAHRWRHLLTSGQSSSFAEIARQENIDTRHVARTVRLAFLAPDIIESILVGREPSHLTSESLLKFDDLPTVWSSQLDRICSYKPVNSLCQSGRSIRLHG